MEENGKIEELKDDDLKNENLHPKAQYTVCDKEHQEAISLTRFVFSEIYKALDQILNPGRETSLAYTKLEEAQMWAIKGLTREPQNKEE